MRSYDRHPFTPPVGHALRRRPQPPRAFVQPRIQLGKTLLDLSLTGHTNILGQKWFCCYTYFLTVTKVMRSHIGVHFSGMRQNDIVDGLSGKAFSGNYGALIDLTKQSPRYDGADSAPFIHCSLGPDRNRYRSNAAVLADQIGDDPAVLYYAELRYRNRRSLAAPKATAEKDCQDGSVPFAPN